MPKPKTAAPDHTLNHLVSLIGGRITSVETAGDGRRGTMYGLTVVKDSGEEVICWILRDPEGNGPGWLDIEEK